MSSSSPCMINFSNHVKTIHKQTLLLLIFAVLILVWIIIDVSMFDHQYIFFDVILSVSILTLIFINVMIENKSLNKTVKCFKNEV